MGVGRRRLTVLEPLDGLRRLDLVSRANLGLASVTLRDTLSGPRHAAVEIHAVDTDGGVVLDTEINVLADTETEVTRLGEVALAEFIFLDLEATLENLLGLGASHRYMDGDLLVTADTEGSDSVSSLACELLAYPSA